MIVINIRICVGIVLCLFVSCQNGKHSTNATNEPFVKKTVPLIAFAAPFNGIKYPLGETIDIAVKPLHDSIRLDSVKIFLNGAYIRTLHDSALRFKWEAKNVKLGSIKIEAEAYCANCKPHKTQVNIMLTSNIKPQIYTYRIVKTFPHSRDAYTQGLIYEDGFFYESDGQYEKSALRKVKLETGEAVNYAILPPRIFAEGIALYNDKIFQLSYREKTCFVYDKKSFKQERQFQYNIDEGWGLTYDGKNFLMTDGSNYVYFLDPESFTETGRIEVVDNEGPIDSLNELEYINDKLYANVYLQDYIIIIDPKTGMVMGKIDFAGLLPKTDYQRSTDVLNGIAYNPGNGHLFITGKNWPKLYEITIQEK